MTALFLKSPRVLSLAVLVLLAFPIARAAEDPAADPHAHGAPMPKDDLKETPFPDLSVKLDFHDLEMLAIQEGGRKKPLQTYACEQVEQLVGRPLFASKPYVADKNNPANRVSAMDLLLGVWLRDPDHPEKNPWATAPIVFVSYLPLRKELGLDPKQKHFSPEVLGNSRRLQALCEAADSKRRSGEEKSLTTLEREAEVVQQRLSVLDQLMRSDETLSLIPHPNDPRGTWLPLDKFHKSFEKGDQAAAPYYSAEQGNAIFARYQELTRAYAKRDPQAFAKAAREFRTALTALSPSIYPSQEALEREVNYNTLRPFGKSWMLYLVALVLGLLALKIQSRALLLSMFAFYILGLGFHVYGFALRCLIAGRPPVSNMYESVIWVGFGAVLLGLIFELIYRRKYFALCGAGAGCLCLVLMDLLPAVMGNPAMPGFEAKINPLVPVLRDNFWLTVHVLTITLSYAAFMLAWILGHVTLGKRLFSPGVQPADDESLEDDEPAVIQNQPLREMHLFVYRSLQVGVLLLAIGTILGGVWAYYSWGRFWGWDPKETWAFIALMCYLFVLHGRYTKWWGNFGVSVGAVICFQAVVMAWYGVNFVLGSGLHAYASGSGSVTYILPIVILDVIFTAAAILRHNVALPVPSEPRP
ncbi:MAG TPA: cytochrome c biogenesis protein CcsA [Planctomycetota bacterium]|jgi:cytochrome c-type biogenesis protein CcsB